MQNQIQAQLPDHFCFDIWIGVNEPGIISAAIRIMYLAARQRLWMDCLIRLRSNRCAKNQISSEACIDQKNAINWAYSWAIPKECEFWCRDQAMNNRWERIRTMSRIDMRLSCTFNMSDQNRQWITKPQNLVPKDEIKWIAGQFENGAVSYEGCNSPTRANSIKEMTTAPIGRFVIKSHPWTDEEWYLFEKNAIFANLLHWFVLNDVNAVIKCILSNVCTPRDQDWSRLNNRENIVSQFAVSLTDSECDRFELIAIGKHGSPKLSTRWAMQINLNRQCDERSASVFVNRDLLSNETFARILALPNHARSTIRRAFQLCKEYKSISISNVW
jgi:hypothetical protein